MYKHNLNDGRGFIWIIIIIVIALLVLSYYGFSLRNLANSPTTQDNFSYIWNNIVYIWNTYLEGPATYLWNTFINLIWNPAIQNLENMKNNEPTTINTSSPQLPTNAPTVQ